MSSKRAAVSVAAALAFGSMEHRVPVHAQQFDFLPSLAISQVYDTNLFVTSTNRQADWITRVSPSVDADVRATLLTLSGRYTIDLERFAQHEELNSAAGRQRAALTLDYRPTPRVAVLADAAAATTETPGELNVVNGLAVGRARAQQLAGRVRVSRDLSERTNGSVGYTFTDGRIAGGIRTEEHAAKIGTLQRLNQRDTVTADYGVRLFRFASGDSSMFQTSHAITLGWNRTVTQRAAVSLSGGPRVTNGSPAPEVSFGARYRLADGEVSFDAARAQTTVLGLAGVAAISSVAGSLRWRLTPSMYAAVTPGFYYTTLADRRAAVYRTTIAVLREISSNLAIDVTFDGNVQMDNLYFPVAQRISRHQVIVRLMTGPAKTLGSIHAR
jgi:hypothetical protein